MVSFQQIKLFFMLLPVVLFLAGTRACQEDYDFASQSGLPTPTATPEDDDDDDLVPVPTPTASPTPTPNGTPAPTPTPDDEDLLEDDDFLDDDALLDDEPGLLEQLAALDSAEDSSETLDATAKSHAGTSGTNNWLGEAFSGMDPIQAESTYVTMKEIMQGFDDDLDGIPNAYEILLGTNPFQSDSNRNGYYDIVELLLGSDPADPYSRPAMSPAEAQELFQAINPYELLIESLKASEYQDY